jgi:hypothetical protein
MKAVHVHVDAATIFLKIAATNGPIDHPPDNIRVWSHSGMILIGKNWRTLRKVCPSAILPTKSPTWTDPDTNPGLCSERPTTKHASHGTSYSWRLLSWSRNALILWNLHVHYVLTKSCHWTLTGDRWMHILLFKIHFTERHGWVVNTHALHSGVSGFKSWHRDQLSWLMFPVIFLSPSRQMPVP